MAFFDKVRKATVGNVRSGLEEIGQAAESAGEDFERVGDQIVNLGRTFKEGMGIKAAEKAAERRQEALDRIQENISEREERVSDQRRESIDRMRASRSARAGVRSGRRALLFSGETGTSLLG